MSNLLIRRATLTDAEPLLAIYHPFVVETAVSFEVKPPSVEEFRARIEKALSGWAWFVAEVDGVPVGYAYGSQHRARAAYKWSVEVSAYIHPAHQGKGLGRGLYGALLPHLAEIGYCNAYAGITLPNEASMGFHRAMGFEHIGVFKSAGWKFGQWHNVAWLHLPIRERPPL
ncbi:MAG: GNAT family N-acetyltransferase [Anaerolineales bacterium]